jgi:hypothetical protein
MFVRSYTVSVDGGRDDRKIKSFDVSSPLKIRIRICEHSLFLSDCFEINDHCSKWSLWLLVDCTNVIKMAGSLFIRLTAAVLEQFFSRCARLIMLLQVHASWLNFQIRCTKKFMFFESPFEHQKKHELVTWRRSTRARPMAVVVLHRTSLHSALLGSAHPYVIMVFSSRGTITTGLICKWATACCKPLSKGEVKTICPWNGSSHVVIGILTTVPLGGLVKTSSSSQHPSRSASTPLLFPSYL